jgi:predicted alpha/beta superfamily hydrolase
MRAFFIAFIALLASTVALAQVTFRITQVPNYTPPNATLYIAGSFNGWNPGSATHALARQPDSSWLITLPAGSGSIQYKFTRGSWASVEGNATGAQRPNRSFTYGNGDTVNVSILSWEDLHSGGGGGGSSTANAQVQVLTDSFFMPQLNRYRRIWLYLPPDYATATTKRYPVIYMHDGQNLFDNLTAFAGEWQIDETLSQLHAQGNHGAIVVGINNGGSQRINEYSPWVNAQYGGGQGDEYVDFIVQTLKPWIDARYRTDSTRLGTAIGGSSMGGLISQYAAVQYQNVFSKVAIFSPSLWFSPSVYTQVSQTGKQHPMRFYVLAGALESSNMVAQVTQLQTDLLAAGFSSSEVQLVIKADGQHSEWFWRREFAAAYQWLFAQGTGFEHPDFKEVKVYPNPTTDRLWVDLAGQSTTAHYRIHDALGRLCNSGTLEAGDSIAVSELPKGVYQFEVSVGQEVWRSRFVKR